MCGIAGLIDWRVIAGQELHGWMRKEAVSTSVKPTRGVM
jgi:hypothetical protein